MPNSIFENKLIRLKSRVCEIVDLEPIVLGETHVELRIEVYENASGVFTTTVFSKEVFLIESAFLSGPQTEQEKRGMYTVFVQDMYHDTSEIRAETAVAAINMTVHEIHKRLIHSGEKIQYLSDLNGQ